MFSFLTITEILLVVNVQCVEMTMCCFVLKENVSVVVLKRKKICTIQKYVKCQLKNMYKGKHKVCGQLRFRQCKGVYLVSTLVGV